MVPMSRKSRFDLEALEDLAGKRVFARGVAYHHAGRVAILAVDAKRVLARVAGTEDYRVELTGRGERLGGMCTCPAFDRDDICKHMVATALAASELGNGVEVDDGLTRIRRHLERKNIGELVDMIIGLAEQDPALFRRLDVAAAAVDADVARLDAVLRRAVDEATRTRGFVEYAAAGGWATEVDEALDALAGVATGRHAALALALAERAIERIEAAIEDIDDSDGHCSALLDRAQGIHLAAAQTARPEPVALARNLFAREIEGQYDTFVGAASLYAEVLGKDGLAEYRRLADAAWKQLAPRSNHQRHAPTIDYRRLADILDFFAERDGDVEARIAIRAKDLSSPWHYLQLAEFCVAQGRQDEALRRAEEGLWLFEDDRPDERLVFFAADLLAKLGRKGEAEPHLWRAFKKAPSLELYKRFGKIGGAAARERALDLLATRLAQEKRTTWHQPADLLIRILIEEKRLDAAWDTVRKHGVSMPLRERLARASEATHPVEALETYAARVGQLVESGGSHAYAEAADLIGRMAGLHGAAEQTAYIAELKGRFGRRRNFIKLLV